MDSAAQKKIDKLVEQLPGAIESGLTAVINWIKAYAEVETTQADCHRLQVCQLLKDADYVTNDYSGDKFVENNKFVMGRYIVGQVLTYLEKDSGLPNAAQFFPDRYNAMPGNPVVPPGAVPKKRGPITVMRPLRLKPGQ